MKKIKKTVRSLTTCWKSRAQMYGVVDKTLCISGKRAKVILILRGGVIPGKAIKGTRTVSEEPGFGRAHSHGGWWPDNGEVRPKGWAEPLFGARGNIVFRALPETSLPRAGVWEGGGR